ncbi:MAG: hypothetical protein IKY98_02660 [Alphaproteobacteria bacterium]|nr:hypothetical protein [Alphaproteobacteria bacterium]
MKELDIVAVLKRDDLSIIKEVISKKGVDCQDEQGQTLLMRGVVHGASIKVIEYLLDNGARVDVLDNRGYSPLDVLEDDARKKIEIHRQVSLGSLLCYQTEAAKIIMKMLSLDASSKSYHHVRHILSRSPLDRETRLSVSHVR